MSYLAARHAAVVAESVDSPVPWRFSARGIAVRLFVTCWLIFAMHFASNTVREIYLALAIGDHLSFRVDEYAHMHPDLFEKPGYGWHIGANPGASMLGAIPYALSRPVVDRVVAAVNRARAAQGRLEPPAYSSPWPMSRDFYRESWRRGLDIKFGLGALIMQVFCMAPVSSLGVLAMFWVLHATLRSDRTAFWLTVLYAFGTPVFYRAGYLNHNMMIGHFALWGFLSLWNPSGVVAVSPRWRLVLGGTAGGAALLLDYSGIVLLLALCAYAFLRRRKFQTLVLYAAGAAGPISILWLYQWASFGNPFLPGQHWMPRVEWIERGYQGFGPPQWELLRSLAFDYRYGLFVSCPLFLLALLYPWAADRRLPRFEMVFCLAVSAALFAFCGGINYTRLQFNSGIRYLAPLFPFMFLPAVAVLLRLRHMLVYFIGVASIAQAWCMAMYRDVERGYGVMDPILQVFAGGFKLPVLSVLSRMSGQYGDYFTNGVSPLPLFALAAAALYGVWAVRKSEEYYAEPSHRRYRDTGSQ